MTLRVRNQFKSNAAGNDVISQIYLSSTSTTTHHQSTVHTHFQCYYASDITRDGCQTSVSRERHPRVISKHDAHGQISRLGCTTRGNYQKPSPYAPRRMNERKPTLALGPANLLIDLEWDIDSVLQMITSLSIVSTTVLYGHTTIELASHSQPQWSLNPDIGSRCSGLALFKIDI